MTRNSLGNHVYCTPFLLSSQPEDGDDTRRNIAEVNKITGFSSTNINKPVMGFLIALKFKGRKHFNLHRAQSNLATPLLKKKWKQRIAIAPLKRLCYSSALVFISSYGEKFILSAKMRPDFPHVFFFTNRSEWFKKAFGDFCVEKGRVVAFLTLVKP